jgi:acetyl esterase/lipase
MPIMDRLDPQLAAVVAQLPATDLSDIAAARAALAETVARFNTAGPNPAIDRSDHRAPGVPGHPHVLLRVFRPAAADGVLPCLYWTQGGGFVLTKPDLDDQYCEALAEKHGCVVISVDWRRAPEHPFPAAAEDCYAGLAWAVRNAAQLRIDPTRVVIGGYSSGGGLTAALALLVRDRREFTVAHQLLIYPMLDDTNSTPSSFAVTDSQVWNRASNQIAWHCYLGDALETGNVSPYAAPARMEDLSGLPPATVLTGELDLFADEDIRYAQRLTHAGVTTELHVYPAAHHGFDRLLPSATVSQRFIADRDAALRRAFAGTRPGALPS